MSILTFTAELAAWVLIAAGLGVIGIAGLVGWACCVVAGSADDDEVALQQLAARDALHNSPRNHGEGDGVGELGVGVHHLGEDCK